MITLGVIAKHGADTFRTLIDKALLYVDAAVVAVDNNPDSGIIGYRGDSVQYFSRPLNMDFASQRNAVCERVVTEWVLFMDTDEALSDWMWANLKSLLPSDADLVLIPRRNDMDGVGTFINWPDWQPRLHRRHVRWHKPVHEWPVGFCGVNQLPADEKYAIIHRKTPAQQDVANKLYERILTKPDTD